MRRMLCLPSDIVLVTLGLMLTGVQLRLAQESATPDAGTASSTVADIDLMDPPVVLWKTTIGMAPVFDQPTPGVGEGIVVTSGPTGLAALDRQTSTVRRRVGEQPS